MIDFKDKTDNEKVRDIFLYYRKLYITNEKVKHLKEININKDEFEVYDLFSEIIDNIFLFIPCKSNDEKIKYISKADGLNYFISEFPYIRNCLDDIVKKYSSILIKLKLYRNKSEHNPVELKQEGIGSTKDSVGIEFAHIKENESGEKIEMKYHITTDDIIKVLECLNKLFEQIRNDIKLSIKSEELSEQNREHYEMIIGNLNIEANYEKK